MAPHIMTGVALVTGAASGIGRATVHAFADEGVTRFVLADLNRAGLEAVKAELEKRDAAEKIQTVLVETDTSVEADVQRMVDDGAKAFGAIHYCVNAAGITSTPRARSHELSIEAWDRVQGINLRGVWLCMRAELTQMVRQEADLEMKTGAPPQRGSIVNISSVLGRVGNATSGSYAAAKAGVLGLSRTDAAGYGRDGIRVNSVCPGVIMTPLMEKSLTQGSAYDAVLQRQPISRYGSAEEVAQVCVFLASTRSSFVTGEEIVVDGGLLHSI